MFERSGGMACLSVFVLGALLQRGAGFQQSAGSRGYENDFEFFSWTEGPVGGGAPPVTGEAVTCFVLPHSHDDPGWVRTSDQYFDFFVGPMYTTVVESLKRNPERKFQVVEVIYFRQWWSTVASASQQADARAQIASGQLEFVVGGWVMADEAIVDYTDLIETMTLGHEWILDNFGASALPRHGFQVDPFGASSAFAAISAKIGFESHLVARLNYYDKGWMQRNKELEFVWRPNAQMYEADGTEIFTHIMDEYQYSSPFMSSEDQLNNLCALPTQTDCPGGGFYWDGDTSKPSQAWAAQAEKQGYPVYPLVNSSNVEFYADYVVNNTLQRASWFKHSNVLWSFGTDFQFFNATAMYSSMDKIIAHVASNNAPGQRYDGVTLRYGMLSDYFDAVHEAGIEWSLRGEEDFLPYNTLNCGGTVGLRPDQPCSENAGPAYDGISWPETWSGFYTSHVHLKIEQRRSAELLRASGILGALQQAKAKSSKRDAASGNDGEGFETLISGLRDAVALLPHHDAGCGNDPEKSGGLQSNDKCAFLPIGSPANAGAVTADYSDRLESGRVAEGGAAADAASGLLRADGQLGKMPRGDGQLSLDMSAFYSSLSAGEPASVVVFNPLGQRLTKWIKVALPPGVDDAVVRLARSNSTSARDTNATDDDAVISDVIAGGDLDCYANSVLCEEAILEASDFSTTATQLNRVRHAPEGTPESSGLTLYFLAADLPPLGMRTFTVTPVEEEEGQDASYKAYAEWVLAGSAWNDGSDHADVRVSSDSVELRFRFGKLSTVQYKGTDAARTDKESTMRVEQSLLEYESFSNFVNTTTKDAQGHESWSLSYTGARSGSYLLHPSTAEPGPIVGAFAPAPRIAVVQSKRGHVTEVRQQFSATASQVVRLYDAVDPVKGDALGLSGAIEIQQAVGPLEPNREFVSLFETDIETQASASGGSVFFSDNNGLQMQRREFSASRSHPDGTTEVVAPSPTYSVSLNYFPLTREAFIEDDSAMLRVLAAQSGAVTSRSNGHLEIMVHRRSAQDDSKGACSVFNDTSGFYANIPNDTTAGTTCSSYESMGTCRADACPAFCIPMNVSTRVYPTFWLLAGDSARVTDVTPHLGQLLNNLPTLFFAAPGGKSGVLPSSLSNSVAPLGTNSALPAGVHVLTLRSRDAGDSGTVVLRLQNIVTTNIEVDFALAGLCEALGGDGVFVSETTLNTVWPVDVLSSGERKRWVSTERRGHDGAAHRTPCASYTTTVKAGDLRTWLVA